MSQDGSGYRFRSFGAGWSQGGADAETTAWLEATALGFHEAAPTAEHILRVAQAYQADDRVLTGVYAADAPARSLGAEHPVATYATFTKPMNVGGGRSLDAHLIAGVTVRSTHRRRGLMREVITTDLRRAAEKGLAIAALSSMEATIYGRFGFGAATFSRRVEVDVGTRFRLIAKPDGIVEVVDPAVLCELAPEIFDRFHARTLGSIQRQSSYPTKITGIWAEDKPEPDRGVRAAAHYDRNGAIDGYVTYTFMGWDHTPPTITVLDLVATTNEASLGLWDYLASIDLISRATLVHASLADPLPWGLEDRRVFNIVGEEDGLWLRVLDPIAALQARSYESDGELRIALSDPLGIAAGVYTLVVRDGQASVVASGEESAADVSMDVSVLGSLYLGGASARVLERAGRLVAASSVALDTLDRLLSHRDVPFCATHF